MTDPYASGVLDEDEHQQLVANLPKVLAKAGIAGHPEAVWTALAEVCGEMEVAWVTNLWDHAPAGRLGLFYDLGKTPDVHTRMVALTGCLVRNFVSARLVTLSQAIDDQREDGGYLEVAVLLIPNFFAPADARDTPSWRRALIHEIIMRRVMAGKQTLVGIAESRSLPEYYGKQVDVLLKTHFYEVLT